MKVEVPFSESRGGGKRPKQWPPSLGKASAALYLEWENLHSGISADAVLGAESRLNRHVCNLGLMCTNKLKPKVIDGKTK